MKKIKSILFFCASCLIAFGQTPQVAIFVYPESSVPLNALRSQLTSSFLNGDNSKYEVVDRTDEILSLLKQEYQYQGNGLVRDDQLVSIGDHLAANYLCVLAITHYPQYNQYFFEGKIIDVETRKVIKNTLYPNEEIISISSLDPQTQLRVAKELAKQLDLYSEEQIKEEHIKQITEQDKKENAKLLAQAEARGLQIGDIINVDNMKFRIGYLDGTRKHGIMYRIEELANRPPVVWAPTSSELMLIYENRNLLGLNEEYWTADLAKKGWYYTIDFSNGNKQIRQVGTGMNNSRYKNYRRIAVLHF